MILLLICKYFFVYSLFFSNYSRPIKLINIFAHVYSTSWWLYLHVFRRYFVDDFCFDIVILNSIICKNCFKLRMLQYFWWRNLISDYISIIWKPMVWADGWKYSWDDNECTILLVNVVNCSINLSLTLV